MWLFNIIFISNKYNDDYSKAVFLIIFQDYSNISFTKSFNTGGDKDRKEIMSI